MVEQGKGLRTKVQTDAKGGTNEANAGVGKLGHRRGSRLGQGVGSVENDHAVG
jgi:hypothetical protein